ncbi:hypothetical protein FNU76_02380 [Chitinimonas arctica]|uniref:Head-tail adaptor protein n=1 Tax=Chitinimonas arctica TaxID=2594795 RepID=A0A516SAW3_9NEIS|nr:hypothetical protein [Chitinimonas arctica]QDQ25291.1 hypothetical protein FNU76_02380 [Chitinimonas arctica]
MDDFRALSGAMDGVLLDVLGDAALVDGRPVRGMFAAPWLQPQFGRLKTAIVEPQLSVRDADAVGIVKGATVVVDGLAYEVVGIEPDGTGWTAVILRPAA